MVNRELEPGQDTRENPDGQNPYQQRVSELKTSQYFWYKNRTKGPDVFRIMLLGCTAIIISAFVLVSIWDISSSLINNTLFSSIIVILVFVLISIIMQPSISSKILKKFVNICDSHLIKVNLLKNMDCFFYKDVDTGKLHDEVLFIDNNGNLSAFGLFKIDTVPIQISGEFIHLIRAIYAQKIPFFWNYVQAPIAEKEVLKMKNVSLDMRKMLAKAIDDERNSFLLNKEGIWEARIVFGTSTSKRIINNAMETIKKVYEDITANLRKLESAFQVNFPHSKIVALKDKEIVSAINSQLSSGGQFRFF